MNCPICTSQDSKKIATTMDHEYKSTSKHYDFIQCQKCKSLRISPTPTQAELKAAYPSNYYSFHLTKNYYSYKGSYWGKSFYKNYLQQIKTSITKLANYMKKDLSSITALDYGSGDGFKLLSLQRIGVNKNNLYGYEPYSNNIDHTFQIYSKKNDLNQLNQKIDLIIASHVIEHLNDPNELFKDCKNLLTKNGILIIEMPCPEGWHFNLFKRKHWGGYHTPRHINILTKYAIEHLAHKHDFKVIEQAYINDSWIMAQTLNSVLSQLPQSVIPNFLKRSIYIESKEIPTFSRYMVYTFLYLISWVFNITGGKSSTYKIYLIKKYEI